MQYQTRRLVALDAMRHEGRELTPGDEFDATEVDAGYYLQHRHAKLPEVRAKPVPPAPKVAPPPPAVAAAPVVPRRTTLVARPVAGPAVAAGAPAAAVTTDDLKAAPAQPVSTPDDKPPQPMSTDA